MGETRVDLQHLLEDLRDAYTGPIEETILTEVIANALDASASIITFSVDRPSSALAIVDNGCGMQRRELARYHDIAATTKTRGEGIGFAGVGIKLGLLVSREVITETRRGATHVATRWHLASQHRAPWKWIEPPGLAPERGTGVRLALSNPLSPLLDEAFLEHTIRTHFEPLLDGVFADILSRHYPHGVRFVVGDSTVTAPRSPVADTVPIAIRLARKRTPSAVGSLARSLTPLPESVHGIAISTFGKVIKRGWDWLGLTPSRPDRLSGLVEAPELAACLTLNKSDFVRSGARGATYLAYRKALQEIVSRQLAVWDETRDEEHAERRASRLDRDLERVLEDLASRYPLLHSLVARRRGGQRRLPMPGGNGDAGGLHLLVASTLVGERTVDGGETPPPVDATPPIEPPSPINPVPRASEPETGGIDAAAPGNGATRRARYGLSLRFERRAEDQELARLLENTIWINEAHPAYARAESSRALAYHIALSTALALAPLAVAPTEEHRFVTQFLAEWGAVHRDRRGGRGRLGRRRPRTRSA